MCLWNSQDRLAAASHQEHKRGGDRHSPSAVPRNAVALLGGRVEMLRRRNRLLKGSRIFVPILFEQILTYRQKLNGAVDRDTEMLTNPGTHRPNGRMKVEG